MEAEKWITYLGKQLKTARTLNKECSQNLKAHFPSEGDLRLKHGWASEAAVSAVERRFLISAPWTAPMGPGSLFTQPQVRPDKKATLRRFPPCLAEFNQRVLCLACTARGARGPGKHNMAFPLVEVGGCFSVNNKSPTLSFSLSPSSFFFF